MASGRTPGRTWRGPSGALGSGKLLGTRSSWNKEGKLHGVLLQILKCSPGEDRGWVRGSVQLKLEPGAQLTGDLGPCGTPVLQHQSLPVTGTLPPVISGNAVAHDVHVPQSSPALVVPPGNLGFSSGPLTSGSLGRAFLICSRGILVWPPFQVQSQVRTGITFKEM